MRQGLYGDLGNLSSESGDVYAEMSASGRTPDTSAILGSGPRRFPSWSRGLSPSRWSETCMYLSRRERQVLKD